MMDWTDRHCRHFHRLLSPNARLYTEMVVAQAAIHGDRQRLLGFSAQEHPVALQLGGSDPTLLAQAARIGVEFGYDEINLNVGCPSDRVQSGRFGACLMREPALVGDCVAAMQAVVPVHVPVTVKCRLGVDEDDSFEHLLRFVDTVASAGCGVFVVHARKALLQGLSPRENREIPPLMPERVHALKALRPQLTIVLNGGLDSVALCASLGAGLDGVMLGRAAYHQPWILTELQTACFGTAPPAITEVLQQLSGYIDQVVQRGHAPGHVLRHVLGLFQATPGARRFRQLLTGVRDWRGGAVLREAAHAVGIEYD
jgi:tRNA-dihydrouridine synthase A